MISADAPGADGTGTVIIIVSAHVLISWVLKHLYLIIPDVQNSLYVL